MRAARAEPYNPRRDRGFSPRETRGQNEQSPAVARSDECFTRRALATLCRRRGQGQKQGGRFTVIQGREDGGFSQEGSSGGDVGPGDDRIC